MRKFFTLLFIFSVCLNIVAQDFISKQWNVRITSDDNGHPSKYVRYHFGSDPLMVNQKTYWPLLESVEESGDGGILYGYFREEGNKIFKYVTENDDEYKYYNVPLGEIVYYNFDLELGDTFTSYIDDFEITVTLIDSLELSDGSFRKSIHLQCIDANWLDNSIWVEGIGDLNFGFEGVRLLCGAPEGDWSLMCYYEDSSIQYQNPDANDCFVLSTKNSNFNDIAIHPNPGSDILYIDGLKEDYSIRVLNQVGQLIKTSKGNNNELSIDNLEQGSYFLTIQTQDHFIVKSFIKI